MEAGCRPRLGGPLPRLASGGGIDLRTTPRAHLSVVTRAGAAGSAHLGALPSSTHACVSASLCLRAP